MFMDFSPLILWSVEKLTHGYWDGPWKTAESSLTAMTPIL